jgi:tetratricopeptide (TPR) repeat protein
MAMLARDPSSRPKDAEVVRILAGIKRVAEAKPAPLLGRQQEWQVLDGALDRVKSGQMVVVHTFGHSGMGKTTLLQRFTDEVASEDVVVLKGRCFEQESVPYNALDSLMDSLCWYLAGLPRQIVLELIPEDIACLTQLFPVLKSIHAVADSIQSGEVEIEPKEQRRRAFSALRELIGIIAERRTVVFLLDDLQWGDVDSAALLRSLLKPPGPPRILLLACYRTEGIENSPLVQSLRAVPQEPGESEHLDLPITELSRDASLELVRTLLVGEKADQLAESIAEESKGNPFFIQTLAGFTTRAMRDAPEVTDKVSLEKALEVHLDSLSDQARTFLELVAVAGVPVHEKVLRQALGEESVEQTTVRILRGEHLIRTSAIQQRNVIEPYHDQIRRVVVGLLTSDRLREHHQRLGDAFEKQGGVDPETLAAHFEGAGDRSKASTYVIQAAQRASDALAFDRAAALYWRAVTLQPGRDASETRELKAKLAAALSNAGRGSEAAPLFQTAAEGAEEQVALERRRRAAEEWMKNGHIDAGLDTLRQVLAARGMKLASTPRRAVFSLLWRRLQLRLRGYKFTQKTEDQIDPEILARIDLCWAVWVCLGMADFIRATEFHTLNMMHSLNAGEPYRIARALVMEATYLATTGARAHRRVTDMLELAGRLANQVKSRHAKGLVDLGTGFTSYLEGRFRHVHAPCERAEMQLRGLPGASWELSNARHYLLEGLMYTGRLVQDGELLSSFLEDAESRGDLFGELSLRTHAHTRLLADDQPELALQTIEHAMSRYTEVGVHISHYWDFYARGQIKLYTGEGLSGWAQVTRKYKRLKRAQVLRVEVARQGAHYLRGRMALCALAEHGHPVPGFLRAAWRQAKKMERDKTDWGQAGAWLIRAAVLAQRGDPSGAQAMLRQAIDVFDAVEMVNWAAAARRGLGCLVGGKQGQHLIAESEEVMMEQRIRDPRRFACMLAPGFDNPGRVGTHG